ncbi:MAG: hypothetical protein A2Z25_06075 [Planctomycetes bacterium RBG_16_55_9]|nr:MAG: hypothetical protein A2Z25_06075 [Planctomycetes bacterium RBG_16_55_9]
MVMYGQALTGGRAGYLAWGSVGLIMCIMRWHKYLILAPVVLILLPVIFPGAASRMFEGFGEVDVAGQATINQNAVTSDRKLFWPYIVAKIEQSPLIGYGRLAMRRTGLVEYIETEHPGIGASQPHNMYLETLLDNGIVGSLPIFLFWAMMVVYSAVLFRSPNHLFAAVGGLSLSLMLAQIFSGIGSQHVYPEESTFGMWTAIFLTLRVHVEEKKARVETAQAEAVWRAPVYVRQKNAVSVQTNWATS